MRVLAGVDYSIRRIFIDHQLPQAAVELFNVKHQEIAENGAVLTIEKDGMVLTALIFRPGTGSRFILKHLALTFKIYIKKLNPFQRVLAFFFGYRLIDAYLAAAFTEKECLTKIIDFLKDNEEDILFHSNLRNRITDSIQASKAS